MIAVIDYEMGNLQSVSQGLERAGVKVKVTADPTLIFKADGVVLPGVGAFAQAMKNLGRLKLNRVVYEVIKKGVPFLGICLGLQVLFEESEEGEKVQGLELLKGKVKKFSNKLKVPHMGWNTIEKMSEVQGPMLKNIPDESYFYFVHSYYVQPQEKNIILTTTPYGKNFVSAVQRDNIFAVQFHPEKSGELGLKILKNFVALC